MDSGMTRSLWMMNCRLTDKTCLEYGKKAILFDVDDTLYDVIYPITRKYSDHMYSQAMSG